MSKSAKKGEIVGLSFLAYFANKNDDPETSRLSSSRSQKESCEKSPSNDIFAILTVDHP
ncbi:DUF6500 family protein [Octadecabacter ascidiaceicola]|uniref:DUF6500 family protein n=1 Tax=Octadecabacter ascidiaceicola TaxID=1655543 RepID=UPI001FECE5F8|nr:DUF6500 family protein [Octadecabacter ascidiaceicola]